MNWTFRILFAFLFFVLNAEAVPHGPRSRQRPGNNEKAKYLLVEVPDEHLKKVLNLRQEDSRSSEEGSSSRNDKMIGI